MDGGFNDYYHYNEDFSCFRSERKLKKKINKLNISGDCPCIECGESILLPVSKPKTYASWGMKKNDISLFRRQNKVLCNECDIVCKCCNKTIIDKNNIHTMNKKNYCEKCYEERLRVCNCCGKPYKIQEELYGMKCGLTLYFRFTDGKIYDEDIMTDSKTGKLKALNICEDCIEEKVKINEFFPIDIYDKDYEDEDVIIISSSSVMPEYVSVKIYDKDDEYVKKMTANVKCSF